MGGNRLVDQVIDTMILRSGKVPRLTVGSQHANHRLRLLRRHAGRGGKRSLPLKQNPQLQNLQIFAECGLFHDELPTTNPRREAAANQTAEGFTQRRARDPQRGRQRPFLQWHIGGDPSLLDHFQ